MTISIVGTIYWVNRFIEIMYFLISYKGGFTWEI